ncbi:hypothetical protein GGF38_006099, partial [Coemansia sp. RSA 25]
QVLEHEATKWLKESALYDEPWADEAVFHYLSAKTQERMQQLLQQQQQQQQAPHMGSPRSRASTYNGPAQQQQQQQPLSVHTGNFGTLTANTQPPGMMVPPHQPPNSAPSSPYQQSPIQHPQYQQQQQAMGQAPGAM